MSKVTFYPLGNADSYLLSLPQKNILVDFASKKDFNDSNDKRVDLPTYVKKDINWPDNKEIDVVIFSHIDDDHVKGSGDFFYFQHSETRQGNDRVKIKELWVPAAAITEKGTEGDARLIRQEARHRLRNGQGIRVFSKPEHLEDWFNSEGLSFEERKHLLSNAGEIVPGLTIENDGVELFVHAPFFSTVEESSKLDRNDNSIVLHATFEGGATMLLTDDITSNSWDRIVELTEKYDNEERLEWDLMKGSHHCSYKALNTDSEKKGATETTPTDNVEKLLNSAKNGAILVLTCDKISSTDEVQPPHFQAKNCYDSYIRKVSGEIHVTMEYPSESKPDRLVFDISPSGFCPVRSSTIASSINIQTQSPRMG